MARYRLVVVSSVVVPNRSTPSRTPVDRIIKYFFLIQCVRFIIITIIAFSFSSASLPIEVSYSFSSVLVSEEINLESAYLL